MRVRVMFVGDLHGNQLWWWTVVIPTAIANNVDLIIQVGDCGFWRHRRGFLRRLRRSPIPVWCIEGNHEDYEYLAALRQRFSSDPDGSVPMLGNLTYLPRGTLKTLSGVSILFCGGAHSIDRLTLTPGVDWFSDETLSDGDIARCVEHGKVDVLVTHDAPNRWEVPGTSGVPLDMSWRAEVDNCTAHRDRVAVVFDAAEPSLSVHGHYHVGYARRFETGWGDLSVVGLDREFREGNLIAIDFEHGAWSQAPLELVQVA